jgi:hypothetical protein
MDDDEPENRQNLNQSPQHGTSDASATGIIVYFPLLHFKKL